MSAAVSGSAAPRATSGSGTTIPAPLAQPPPVSTNANSMHAAQQLLNSLQSPGQQTSGQMQQQGYGQQSTLAQQYMNQQQPAQAAQGQMQQPYAQQQQQAQAQQNQQQQNSIQALLAALSAPPANQPAAVQPQQGYVQMGMQQPAALPATVAAVPEAVLPSDATPTLLCDAMPMDFTRREAAHIFRPIQGFKASQVFEHSIHLFAYVGKGQATCISWAGCVAQWRDCLRLSVCLSPCLCFCLCGCMVHGPG